MTLDNDINNMEQEREPRSPREIARDVGRGIVLVGIGTALGYATMEYTSWMTEIIREDGQAAGSPVPPPIRMIVYSPAFVSAIGSISTAIQGIGRFFGKDFLGVDEQPYQQTNINQGPYRTNL